MKIVLCDICGTLYLSNTTFDFLDFFVKKNSYKFLKKFCLNIVTKKINALVYYFFKIDMIRSLLLLYLRGYSYENLKCAANEFYLQFLEQRKNDLVLKKLEELKAAGCQIFLVSATIDVIAETIGGHLNATRVFSTKLLYDKFGICQGKIDCDLLGNKLPCLIHNNVFPPFDIVVTDDFSDLSLIRNAISAYIVTYKKKLRRWNRVINKNMLTNISIIVK